MQTHRTTQVVTFAVAGVLALTLSGCANPLDRFVQAGTQKATEGFLKNVTDEEVKIGGTSLPEGFPDEVPIPDGEIVFSGKIAGAYSVTVTTNEQSLSAYIDQLQNAGFTGDDGMESTEGFVKFFQQGDWNVVVTGHPEGDESSLMLVVTNIDDD